LRGGPAPLTLVSLGRWASIAASALGVSVASVRQYRLSADARAHRSPPPGWPEVLAKLAEARGEELIELAQRLRLIKSYGS
jgi:hypothetical protein